MAIPLLGAGLAGLGRIGAGIAARQAAIADTRAPIAPVVR